MKRMSLAALAALLLISLALQVSFTGKSAAALPAGPYLEPNQKAVMGGWEIQVSNGIKWTKELKGSGQTAPSQSGGSSAQGKQAGDGPKQVPAAPKKSQDGMTFALLPISIKNTSNRTASLLVGVWNFYDYTGKMYLMLTLGLELLPEEDQISMKDFKPGELRKGYLPFELSDGIDKKDKYLQLIIPLVGSATWRL